MPGRRVPGPHRLVAAALAGLALLLTACSPFIMPRAFERNGGQAAGRQTVRLEPLPGPLGGDRAALAQAEEELLVELYERTSRGVVSINVTGSQLPGGTGSASGFVLDEEGRLVTNNHVVAQAERLLVTFPSLRQAEARVVGGDPHTDLAIIQVEGIPPDELFPMELGDSSQVRVGQRAIAIGNPFGNIDNSSELPTLGRTMTLGIVSGLGRVVRQPGSEFALPLLIQTDANISPGNSGGPLLDSQGRVIGINTLIFAPDGPRVSTGIGFAVPVDLLRKIKDDLIEKGSYDHPWLGIQGNTIVPDMALECGLPAEHGVLVVRVIADAPAAQAGLRGSSRQVPCRGGQLPAGGDIIVAIDGQAVLTFDDLITHLSLLGEVGQTVTLRIERDGEELDIRVTLGPRPDQVSP